MLKNRLKEFIWIIEKQKLVLENAFAGHTFSMETFMEKLNIFMKKLLSRDKNKSSKVGEKIMGFF